MINNGSVQFESVPCPLGCKDGDEFVLMGKDRLHNLPGEFSVVRCKSCGLMRTNPRPTPETIGFYYPIDYGPYQGTKIDINVNRDRYSPFWKRLLRKSIQLNEIRIPSIKPGSMLEIGCASGAFMHRMTGYGWEVEGIEFSPRAAENARLLGYPVHIGSLETAPESNKLHDMIVGWMVFEHLHDPIMALQKLSRWIRPGGNLVMSVPNAASWEFDIFKNAWYALQLPTHLYHYTPKSLNKILMSGGWKLEKTFRQKNISNVIASIGYVLEDNKIGIRFAKKLIDYPNKIGWGNYASIPFAIAANMFGQAGRMTVWARRID